MSFPQIPQALAAYRQFILYKLVPVLGKKTRKLPVDPATLQPFDKSEDWQNSPAKWTDAATATQLAQLCGPEYGVGFFFTESDPFFFLDIDHCKEGDTWSPLALQLLGYVNGAAVEVSSSGDGLHAFGTGTLPPHACRNDALGLELYSERRFVALTGSGLYGDAAHDCSEWLPALVANYFPQKQAQPGGVDTWTDEPVEAWSGPVDDETLIAKMLASKSAASAFGGSASFRQLWEADVDALAHAYPDAERAWDESRADAALVQHLAFWTGNHCERMLGLLWKSGLVREKWDRDDYLQMTIAQAVAKQSEVYNDTPTPVDTALGDSFGAPALKGTDGQIKWANQIRAEKLLACQGDVEALEALCKRSGPALQAGFWIDNKDKTVEELVAAVTPVAQAASPLGNLTGPEFTSGYQFLDRDRQVEHFAGCVYIQDIHRIFTPTGALLNQERFNATYGGYAFQLETDGGGKTTRKAWDAFTESQAVRYPKAAASVFRPEYPSGAIIYEEGLPLVNTYVPIETLSQAGDAGPFVELMAKLLPDERDRSILLSYMAALVQNPGRKFQWWPVVQGVKGNGKTLLVSALTHAIGSRYTHCPNVDEMAKSGNKFNGWIRNRLFIGMEEVYVSKRRDFLESFKTTVTNTRLPIENKGLDQIMGDNRANGFMCTNHRDGVPVDDDERRYGIFFTAQQTAADLHRDGMGGNYFPDLYDWCMGRDKYESFGPNYGYSVINNYLQSYAVAEEFNPAGQCQRAPETSSTRTAINESLGSIEQEIIEAIEEGRPGFAGGWVSSKALDGLLQQLKAEHKIPRNKRRELLQGLGYDWHPALTRGRVNNYLATDAGKPVLFIMQDHIARNLTTSTEVAKRYEQDQQLRPVGGEAVAAFGTQPE